MRVTHDGLALWYGTPDAPALGDGGVAPRRGASMVVGVSPANPTNSVLVRFRVGGGPVQAVSARDLHTDYERQAQYFGVSFPPFRGGETVEYSVLFSCGSRQVPPPHIADRFPSKAQLAREGAGAARVTQPPAQRSRSSGRRFSADLSFVANIAICFDPPQFIGDTAAGMRINFFVRDGTVVGEEIGGRVISGSSDHLIVRRDGMGVIRMRSALALDDGAVLDVESGGYVDWGRDGYRRALAHNLPDRLPVVLRPLISTRHPKYKWLSRVQCVGVGETHLSASRVGYQIYSVAPRAVS